MSETTTEATFTATLKAGADYAAPWLVVRADNPAELEEHLEAVTESLLQKVNDVAQLFQGARNATSVTVAAKADSAASDATVTQLPTAGLKTCAHGVRVKRTGTSSKGPWTGYFCALPKGTEGACKAIFD